MSTPLRYPDRRHIEIVETDTIPPLDVIFAFGPMVPFVLGASATWSTGHLSSFAAQATTLWGSAILLFLSGVRRGLSFRTVGGPTWMQMITMLLLYSLGLGALSVSTSNTSFALLLLIAGYTSVLVLDPIAAHRGEAPLHFARLRRLQIPIALLSLIACLAATLYASA